MVTLPGASEPTTGWIQVDQVTLDVVDVMENGQHTAAVEYDALAQFSVKIASFLGGFAAGFFGHTMGFWIGFFGAMPLGSQNIDAVIAAPSLPPRPGATKPRKPATKRLTRNGASAALPPATPWGRR